MMLSSALILVFGFLRVFVLVGLMTIFPTLTYLRWNKEIKQGVAPTFSASDSAILRRFLHYQLIGICIVLFCASMMAKGFGSFT